jgi:uncharacterized membrane protein
LYNDYNQIKKINLTRFIKLVLSLCNLFFIIKSMTNLGKIRTSESLKQTSNIATLAAAVGIAMMSFADKAAAVTVRP